MTDQTMVLGNDPCAHQVVSHLLSCGKPVCMVTRDKASVLEETEFSRWKTLELLKDTVVLQCKGQVGNFRITLFRNGGTLLRSSGTIIISEAAGRVSNLSTCGLTPDPNRLSISEFSQTIHRNVSAFTNKKIAILTGLFRETHPAMLEEVLHVAHRLQTEFNSQTYIFTTHLKVAGNGLEAFCRAVKEAGTVFYKFSETLPRIFQDAGGSIRIVFTDPTVRNEFVLKPDAVISDETIAASPYLRDLGRIFNIDCDTAGYLQTDNVHRTSVMTNRRGILVAGPSRSVLTETQKQADAKAAVMAVLTLEKATMPDPAGTAAIDTGRCIQCLTCFRICPHAAVTKADRIRVTPEACQGCGICAAECPRQAIRLENVFPPNLPDIVLPHQHRAGIPYPRVVVFGCERAAMITADAADGKRLPANINTIPVPCAGGISTSHILDAFRRGADGIMILACHEGNCHSEQGNRLAAARTERLTAILSGIGIEPERLVFDHLAANMGVEFFQKIIRFEETIRSSYGPLPKP